MIADKYTVAIEAILAKYPPEQKRSAVMPLLYLAQREDGYVTKGDMAEIGEILGSLPQKLPPLLVSTPFTMISLVENTVSRYAMICHVPCEAQMNFWKNCVRTWE